MSGGPKSQCSWSCFTLFFSDHIGRYVDTGDLYAHIPEICFLVTVGMSLLSPNAYEVTLKDMDNMVLRTSYWKNVKM